MRRSFALVLALALCGTLALAQESLDLPRRYSPRMLDSTPVVATDGLTGTAWAAWSYRSRGEFDIALSFRDTDGRWSDPVFIGARDHLDQIDPALVGDDRGNFYLAYVDRHNGPYMSLWSTLPDGTETRAVFGNYTTNPHCVFEPRAIPGSQKLIFTASGHHAFTGGSLVLLDPNHSADGEGAMRRLTPEVVFPETEGWPQSYFANPYPLSESHYLTAWSDAPLSSSTVW